ncbi:MAG: single-stranded DNA-binding protein [Solobacterium sp.]|nr:single-stranded DNA-binding protein [Solobacterium sp.]
MINRVVLVGRLTKDVEVRKTNTGLSVAGFTVACDRNRSRNDENGQQTADFINCTAWRQTADFLGMYAKKGAMVGVDGRIQTRSYDGQDGRRVYVTEVVADSVQLLESRSQSQNRAQQSQQNSFQQPFQNQQQYAPQNDYNSYANSGYNSNNSGYGNNGGYSNNSYNSYNNNGGYNSNSAGNGNDDYSADGGLDISSDDLPF